ncbi:L-asparaginase 1 [Candidatus Calditenuaceae archaeon HR02]|nr:L-asparaginase 1 [Candidatus Calditenuaceae archaeon HR02]
MESWMGYSGFLLEMIRAAGVEIGDEIVVERPDGSSFRGLLMFKGELSAENIVVIKLGNGYNVGVAVDPSCRIRRVAPGRKPAFVRPPPPPPREGLPRVKIIGTGGTIASRVDYRTGAVRPAISSEDLVSLVPELSEIATVDAEVLLSVYSEDLTVREWGMIAEAVWRVLEKREFSGVILTHGTDTMHYTSAALSFALQRPPVPVILVGSQRSSDRPSSDAALNLIGATWAAARAPFAEVVVAMHAGHSDDAIAFHRGTRVVKMHTSSRSAFKSVNASPLAVLRGQDLTVLDEYNPRGGDGFSYEPGFSDRAALVKFYPGMSPEILEYLAERGMRGVVIEGTGLGHVARSWIPVVKALVDSGFFVGMASQCRFGRVNMRVYNTGRDLLRAGVVELGDLLPEVALVKLMWVLYRAQSLPDVSKMMITPVARELGARMLPEGVEPA